MTASRFYDIALRVLIIFLPFSTFLSVFTSQILHIPGVSFLKEFCIFIMLVCLIFEHFRGNLKIVWTRYDMFIGIYMLIMIAITLFTTGIKGLVYGGRYDFSFLVTFFVVFHGFSFLTKPVSYYIRLFLLSGGVALFLSMLLKWPLSEDILLYFGYSGNPSNWQFGSAVPIFHGVEGANIRRFQGIFDGPNTMGAYLLLYIGIFTYYLRMKKDWYFVIGTCVFVFITCIVYTYSRSALLGLFGAVSVILIFSAKYLYQNYKKQVITLLIVGICAIAGVFLQYAGNLQAILERGGSSKGHAERMMTGIERAIHAPLGQGLGSAGPGYRYVQNLAGKDRSEIEKLDFTYIPESWYIQQFIEGGFLGGVIFLLLMAVFFWGMYRIHIILAGMFIAILIMNFFLHTFESSMLVLSLFTVMGLYLAAAFSRHE